MMTLTNGTVIPKLRGATMNRALILLAVLACGAADTAAPERETPVALVVSAQTYSKPFSAESPWNRAIASWSGVRYTPTSAFGNFIPALSTWATSLWVGMHQATTADPRVTLYYHLDTWGNVSTGKWKRSGNSPAVEAEIRAGMSQTWDGYQSNMYSTTTAVGYTPPPTYHKRTDFYWSLRPRMPKGAVPPPDVDGYMAVFQPNGWVLEMIAPIKLADGDYVTLFAGYTNPTQRGTGTAGGRRASMLPNYAGLIRKGELASGSVNHALALGVGPDALAKSFVSPATAFDRNPTDYTGSLPMGTKLAIPPSVNITTLGLQTSTGRILARTMQVYGGHLVDRTGPRYFLILSEWDASDVPASWSGPLDADLRVILSKLQVVTVP